MPEIRIDTEICKRDGLCARACTRAIIEQEEKGAVPVISDEERCFGCGQCVSICPQGAITHSEYPPAAVTPIERDQVATYEQVLELIRARRSQRLFKDKPVERADIEKVLDAARFAPSGHNEQSTEFVVIQDPQRIQEIAVLTAAYLGKLGGQFANPIGRMVMRFILGRRGAAYVGELAPELAHLSKLFEEGTDWVVRRPPALLLFCADSAGGTFAATNATLALQNATLAAEALGLGCFFAGFVLLASDRDNRIAKLAGLPETHEIYGALAMGYPRLKFKSWPQRKPARVTWL